ncbi:M48 family metalloprotease [Catelliglobosispora koreensis]|uniref:M48 family metalloprotease n=1 Tax=Catelliglobosispora koreensis TaxID=129052 RepID=UPI0012FB0A5E|nr:M48 family metallopeptidase [Catelliglobosispora koreensis]
MPPCPHCHIALVTVNNAPPWCERCEFNLGLMEPEPEDGFIARHINVWAARMAFSANRKLFGELAGHTASKPDVNAAFVLLFGISIYVMCALLATLAAGIYLVVTGHIVLQVLGAILVGLAIVLRPRLGTMKPFRENFDEITATDTPAMFALIERAVHEMGAPMPHHVFLSDEWNASASVVGLRRRRVLVIGVPLWICLQPQERVALLGHELGHFVNRDVRRGLLTQPACTIFAQLADLVRPERIVHADGEGEGFGGGSFFAMLGMAIMKPFLWTAFYLFVLLHIAITAVAARATQRAEYFADAIALRLAGSRAMMFVDLLTNVEQLTTVVGARSRNGEGFAGWRKGIEETRIRRSETRIRLFQLSMRDDASLFSTHPPAGYRYRMATTLPYAEPVIVLTESEAATIDMELSKFEQRYAREIAHSW